MVRTWCVERIKGVESVFGKNFSRLLKKRLVPSHDEYSPKLSVPGSKVTVSPSTVPLARRRNDRGKALRVQGRRLLDAKNFSLCACVSGGVVAEVKHRVVFNAERCQDLDGDRVCRRRFSKGLGRCNFLADGTFGRRVDEVSCARVLVTGSNVEAVRV